MRGRTLVVSGSLAAAVVAIIGAASHYGYASTERRLLLAELAEASERTDRATGRLDEAETQLFNTKAVLRNEKHHAGELSADLSLVREQQKTDGVAFAQLAAMWEGERDERAIYKETLRTSAARLIDHGGAVVASELRREVELRFRSVNAGMERAARDVIESEEILAARPSPREVARYHERLSLLDTRGWAAVRMAENLIAFVSENFEVLIQRNPLEGEKQLIVQIFEMCEVMRDDAGMYRRAAQASVNACRETMCSVGMNDRWITTDLTVREGEVVAMHVTGLVGIDHTTSPRSVTVNSAVRLRVQGNKGEYPGASIIRPTSTGRIEVAVDKEAIGRETDQATVTMWTFRPLTGGQ